MYDSKLLGAMTVLLLSVSAGLAQEKPMKQEHMMDQHKHMDMMERHQQMQKMMQDSTMMHMMMDSIATNKNMRHMMLKIMMHGTQWDTSAMKSMIETMMENDQMRMMMARMSDSGKQMGEQGSAEIIVKFKPGVEAVQVAEMEKRVGLKKIKEIPELRMKVYAVTSQKSVQEAITACQKEKYVDYAEPNQTYKAKK